MQYLTIQGESTQYKSLSDLMSGEGGQTHVVNMWYDKEIIWRSKIVGDVSYDSWGMFHDSNGEVLPYALKRVYEKLTTDRQMFFVPVRALKQVYRTQEFPNLAEEEEEVLSLERIVF